MFICVGWQVTLCVHIWQVTLQKQVISYKSVMLTKNKIYYYFNVIISFFAVYLFNKMKIELMCAVVAFLVGTSLAAATPAKPSELF